jgi:hypothetical protein
MKKLLMLSSVVICLLVVSCQQNEQIVPQNPSEKALIGGEKANSEKNFVILEKLLDSKFALFRNADDAMVVTKDVNKKGEIKYQADYSEHLLSIYFADKKSRESGRTEQTPVCSGTDRIAFARCCSAQLDEGETLLISKKDGVYYAYVVE